MTVNLKNGSVWLATVVMVTDTQITLTMENDLHGTKERLVLDRHHFAHRTPRELANEVEDLLFQNHQMRPSWRWEDDFTACQFAHHSNTKCSPSFRAMHF